MQAMWYQKGYSYRKEKRFFFIGFEWESQQAPLKYRILEEFNDLVTREEYKTWKTYFESNKVTRKKSLRKRLNQKVNRIFNKNSK